MEKSVVWMRIRRLLYDALMEDIGTGDITTNATIQETQTDSARFLAKADGVLAGLKVAECVFHTVDPKVSITWAKKDGDEVKKGEIFGIVRGKTRSLVMAERTALNILQRMSGIATMTREFVKEVERVNGHTIILDTRKTPPNLRLFDKMAVQLGGGQNHRMGLSDMVLIKDNHVSAAGSVLKAIHNVHQYMQKEKKQVPIEVEARTLEEVKEVLRAVDEGLRVDRILLDNMVKKKSSGDLDCSMLKEAVDLLQKRIPSEASGNVVLSHMAEIAKTGVDYASTGALTHSVVALDISMKLMDKKAIKSGLIRSSL
eukprot:TRINITY_DN1812_c0_g1_i1.p1 TRINITY_DN1812_c0_g1~~TRINITY_DN1812_c0_g1_i1.p1  ORF type:complete len:314 (+),score=72.97 TRINITY_DN1812_c0_g1_i1:86-1027(+)